MSTNPRVIYKIREHYMPENRRVKKLIRLERPESCRKCDKSYFKQECTLRRGLVFLLYCCPKHEEITLYRDLKL